MKKSYVFNTLICCGCTALIFLLHFIVYGGVLLKSPGYTGLFCAVWIAHAAGYSGTLEPKIRPHTAVRVRLWQLLYCILFGNVLFVTIEEPYNVLCWFCVVYGVVCVIFFLRKGDNGAEPWTATFMMLWMLLTLGAFLLMCIRSRCRRHAIWSSRPVTLTCTVFSPLTGTRSGSRR